MEDPTLIEGIWVTLLDALLPVFASILAIAVARGVNFTLKSKKLLETEREAVELIGAAAADIQDNYIRNIRSTLGDKKLTVAEVNEANKQAYDQALALAEKLKSPAFKIIKQRGIPWVSSKVKGILKGDKN